MNIKSGVVTLFCLAAAITWGYIGSRSIVIGSQRIPAPGSFLSPGEGFWRNGAQSPHENVEIRIEGLSAPVRVYVDDRGIPHIHADNMLDAFSAQGYMHARDRLWQMDLKRRGANGTLSEIIGPATLDYDRFLRRKGIDRAADTALVHWASDPEFSDAIEAYTRGVNNYIHSLSPSNYPVEFKILDYAPREYSSKDAALLAAQMAEVLCGYNEDYNYTELYRAIGPEKMNILFPEFQQGDIPIVQEMAETVQLGASPEDDSSIPASLPSIGHIGPSDDHYDRGIGSNNWAVSASRSSSGAPILANDPHLPLSLPSIWYELHIVTPETNVYGVSFAGAPGIIIGFNEDIAWGVTNMGHDMTDHYTIDWVDDTKSKYRLDGEIINTEYQVDEYIVRGDETVTDSMPYTIWGPVVNYDHKEYPDRQNIAEHWILSEATQAGNTLKTFIGLNRAKNYEDFVRATAHFKIPGQNFVMVSADDDLAMRPSALLPIRPYGNGDIIYDGSTRASAWQGYIPYEVMPAEYNPLKGYVASANQWTTGPDYPYEYNGYFEQYRGRRINQLLAAKEKHSVEDFMKYQLDDYSLKAEYLLPELLKLLPEEMRSSENPYLDSLSNWDYRYRGSSIIPTLFENWWQNFYYMLWDEDIFDNYAPASLTVLDILRDKKHTEYIDRVETPAIESLSDLAQASLEKTLENYNSEPPLSWGKKKSTTIHHLAKIPGFSETVMTGGCGDALNAQTSDFGPSWRMIVEMGSPRRAYGVYPGGQSGDPGSRHYTDLLDYWVTGMYYPLDIERDYAQRAADATYTLNIRADD